LFTITVFLGFLIVLNVYAFTYPGKVNTCPQQIITSNAKEPSSAEQPTAQSVNNIQAAHINFNYSCGNKGLVISDVECGSITGNSMQPTLFTDNTILWFPYDGGELREGWIVRYNTSVGVRAHRIKAVYSDYVRTQGDNNLADEKVFRDDVISVSAGVLFT
jgi:hypothetical protein